MPNHYSPHDKKKPQKTSKFDWRTIFLKNSGGISSKRVCGILGWITCLGLLIAGFITKIEIPQYAELIGILSASLLGLDSITGIWQKTITQQ